MFNNFKKIVEQKGIRFVISDIDGAIKDIVLKHMLVIEGMIKVRNNMKKYEGVIKLNYFFMNFVKVGIFPTNRNMQLIICYLNSILLGISFKRFACEYFCNFNMIEEKFENSNELLKFMRDIGLKYVMVSNDPQNKDFCTDETKDKHYPKVIINTKGDKFDVFKKLLKTELNPYGKPILTEEILVIGDNLWDDVIPAIRLKMNVLWCDKYDSKTKRFVNRLIRLFYKKALDNSKRNGIW